MGKRERCTGEDTGELGKSKRGRKDAERKEAPRAHERKSALPAARHLLGHIQPCVSSQPCD